MSKNLPLCL
ncbi:hypothetical protein YPPY64_3323, partial [Yersinia pestis PY-64]